MENLLLRHQLNIALRREPTRLHLYGIDRAILTGLVRLWPDLSRVVQVVKPDTNLRWHRMGFEPIGAGSRESGPGGQGLTGGYGI